MTEIATQLPEFTLRRATVADAGLLLDFMRKLGAYQKMADQITATEASLHRLLADHRGEAIFGMMGGKAVSFMFFCQNASAFTGRSGLYLDGFYVDETARHHGLGRIMMAWLAQEAGLRGCQMLEWVCLDWNQPALDFYQGLGAYRLDDMHVFRLSPDDMARLANGF